MVGWFYVGYDFLNRVNGYFKIGETGKQYLSTRLGQIRRTDAFECLGFLKMYNVTDSERWFVESFVRVMMERVGFQQVQKDHFRYIIKKGEKEEQAKAIAELALFYGMVACKLMGIEYEKGYKKYKRR